jgi:malic enzyme
MSQPMLAEASAMVASAKTRDLPRRTITGVTQRVSRYGPDSFQPHQVRAGQTGQDILYDPLYNKGIAFAPRERDRFGLRGLLPPRVMSIEEQVKRAYTGFQRAGVHGRTQYLTPSVTQEHVDKHIYLSNLQDRNEVLFHRLLSEHLAEMAPIVYTPVVGYACQHTGELWRRSRGVWVDGHADRGDMHAIVNNWPHKDVDVIVITDGSRILGLGDLGAYGMGIPIGKLITYVAAAGIHPSRTLPMFIDMGTDNLALHEDPLYLGQKKPRLTGAEYLAVFDELMDAITHRWPQALVQFEDIRTPYAEMVLARYRRFTTCFNDDIQGTGSMVVAGLLAALRCKGKQPSEIVNERILCVGAGSAGLGVCSYVRRAMKQEGLPNERSYSRFWVTDKDGLLTKQRQDLMSNQENYARDVGEDRAFLASPEGEHDRDAGCDFNLVEGMPLAEVVRRVKPTILLGLSGVGGVFTEEVLTAMTDALEPLNERPVVFALSNPTDKSECTAEQAYDWTRGRGICAFGSPFAPVVRDGKTVMVPAQGNNIFIYPGVGLASVATRAKRITDEMFYEASKALAAALPEEDLKQGRLFCSINNIREVTHKVACAVAKVAREQGECTEELPPYKDSWEQYLEDLMWRPEYQPLVPTTSSSN